MSTSPRSLTTARLTTALLTAALFTAALLHHGAANADQPKLSPEQLAKLAQNPVGNLVSVPFQNNTYPRFGPERGTLNTLNIQPVIPFELSPHWNLITRTIVPVQSLPAFTPFTERTNGIGDTIFTAWIAPARPSGWIWGAGPVVQLPTHSDSRLGNGNWGLGPSFVLFHLDRQSPWVYGFMINNLWSVTTDGHGGAYNHGVIQPGANYNFKSGFYLTTSPIITVDWRASPGERWTVPVGGGVGKIVHLGPLPINLQLSGYYHVVAPEEAGDWEIRAQVQFLFPK